MNTKELKDMSLEELWRLFPIILKEYNPDYQAWYEAERDCLIKILQGYRKLRINHIGSTSVIGLTAKPIIDILLELPPNTYDLESTARLFRQNNYNVMAQNNIDQTLDLNKGYTKSGFAEKVFHIHIKPLGDWEELYFRDYLRQNSDVCRKYEQLKLRLKDKYEYNRDGYTAAKTKFIKRYTNLAREEFGGRYSPPACQ